MHSISRSTIHPPSTNPTRLAVPSTITNQRESPIGLTKIAGNVGMPFLRPHDPNINLEDPNPEEEFTILRCRDPNEIARGQLS